MNMKSGGLPPKIAAVHDLSCVGRCALTVVLPILSAKGVQVCPLPTALLSTHTGGYEGFTFLDLSDEIPKIANHWKQIGERFDAVYTGFLGSARQIEIISDFVDNARAGNPDLIFLADPVMGDDGKKYATYTDEMCALTGKLAEKADIITPNLTEASILLGIEYKENFTGAEIREMLSKLSCDGKTSVVITGVIKQSENGKTLIGAQYFDKSTGEFGKYFTPRVEKSYPGTGEAFTSVMLGGILSGKSLEQSVCEAAEFVHDAVLATFEAGAETRAGILLEKVLGKLI